MAITAEQVNSLRQQTGVSMMLCKKALEEANGDNDKAIEILRKKGAAKAAEKVERATKEGVIVCKIEGDKGVIVKLLCETDFVSKTDEFQAIAKNAAEAALKSGAEEAKSKAETALKELFTKLGENMSIDIKMMEGQGIGGYVHSNQKIGVLVRITKQDEEKSRDVAMHIAAMSPKVISPEEVSEEEVAKEKEIWIAQLKNEGRPEAIFDKILVGKEKKYREELALMKQPFVKNADETIEQYLGSDNKVAEFIREAI